MDGYTVISNLMVWLRDKEHTDDDAVYRGHSDATWAIQPSGFRDKARGIATAKQLARWRDLAGRFANPIPRSDMEWLVLAQHYGIPTPLLDWTTNPLTALFFACLDYRNETDGCVIKVNRTAFKQYTKPETVSVFGVERKKPGLINSTTMNARTLAQDSVMSIHTLEVSVLQEQNLPVERFMIESPEKWRILRRLKTFGFTADRMFSDLTTAAAEFKETLEDDHIFGFEADDPEL